MKAVFKAMSFCFVVAFSFPHCALADVQFMQPWWIDTGETDSTALGVAMAPLGDINGDGLNDFVVGCSEAETLFVYFGSVEPDTIPDMVIPRPDSSQFRFGLSVFSVGDVNGDGFLDFVAQATLQDIPPVHRLAYLYFGGPLLDTIPDLILDGGAIPSSNFAQDGAGIGNFGWGSENEFIVLDQGYFVSVGVFGRIYVYRGGDALDSIPDLIINADSTYDHIGRDAAALGDVNGDGFADFVMSHPQCSGPQGQSYAGVVAVYYGGAQPDTLPDFVVRGTQTYEDLGGSVATLDYDRDGTLDIVAGNRREFPPDHFSSIYLYLVNESMSGEPDCIFPDPGGQAMLTGDGLFGMDLNGDGWQDIVSCNSDAVLGAGEIWVYLGGENADSLLDAAYFQGHLGASLGAGGCNAGDINGDGIDDLIVGEPGFGNYYDQIHYGRIHVFLGDTDYHQSVGIIPGGPLTLPSSPVLLKAYPNPFNANINFEISNPHSKNSNLRIYNLRGEVIRDVQLKRGQNQVSWDGCAATGLPCASGIYIVRLSSGNHAQNKKITLLR